MTDVPPVTHPAHSHAGGSNPFMRKIGPLPGIAWVVIVVGFAYAWHWYKGKQGGTTVAAKPATPRTSRSPARIGGGPGYGRRVVTSVSPMPQAPGVTTNQEWARAAIEWLTSTGHSASTASTAISNYLGRRTVTETEARLINLAIGEFGPPPKGVYAVRIQDTPKPKPKPEPVPIHPAPKPAPPKTPAPKPAPSRPVPKPPPPKPPRSYVVRPGDSLFSIAAHYYGNGNDWSRLYDANRAVIGADPNSIRPGERLTIP